MDIDGVLNSEIFYRERHLKFESGEISRDDDDMLLKQQEHFFKIDSWIGLTPTICHEIRKFITGKTFSH